MTSKIKKIEWKCDKCGHTEEKEGQYSRPDGWGLLEYDQYHKKKKESKEGYSLPNNKYDGDWDLCPPCAKEFVELTQKWKNPLKELKEGE